MEKLVHNQQSKNFQIPIKTRRFIAVLSTTPHCPYPEPH